MTGSEVMFTGTSALSYRFTPDFPGRGDVQRKVVDTVAGIDSGLEAEAAQRQRDNALIPVEAPIPSTVTASMVDDLLLLTVSIPNTSLQPQAVHDAIVAAVGPISRAP